MMQFAFLSCALVVAIATDLRQHKVYNWLTFPAMGIALVLGALGGSASLLTAVEGFGVGLLLGLLYMVVFRMGAGDAKLLIVIGAFTGPVFVLYAAMYGAIAGAPLALFAMWRRGVLGYTLKNMALNTANRALGAKDITLETNAKAGKLPYAVPIALGVLIAALVRGF